MNRRAACLVEVNQGRIGLTEKGSSSWSKAMLEAGMKTCRVFDIELFAQLARFTLARSGLTEVDLQTVLPQCHALGFLTASLHGNRKAMSYLLCQVRDSWHLKLHFSSDVTDALARGMPVANTHPRPKAKVIGAEVLLQRRESYRPHASPPPHRIRASHL